MTFLAPVAAELSGWTIKKVLPWVFVGVAIAGFGAALWVQSARIGAARSALESAQHDRDVARADAKRWMGSVDQMQRVIADQATQLTRQAADMRKAQQIADEAAQNQAQEISKLGMQLDSLKARAHAHPDQVRVLGPLVRDVLIGLRRNAAD